MLWLVILIALAFIIALVFAVIIIVKPDVVYKIKGMEFDENGEIREGQTKNQMSGSPSNPMDGKTVGDAKAFLPFSEKDGIIDGIINLGYHNYRAIIECSSLNYFLMSEQGQDLVELSFQRFLNSLTFPISLYNQTRQFDTEGMMKNLNSNVLEAEKKFPGAASYMRQYAENMQYLTDYIGNEKIKKKYIIVHFDGRELNGTSLNALNGREIREHAIEQLRNRCQIVINGLAGMGITAKMLDDEGVSECIYAYVHRSCYKVAGDVSRGIYDSLTINKDTAPNTDRNETLSVILNEAQNRINTQVRSRNQTGKEDTIYSYLYDVLEYFKTNILTEEGKELLYQNALEENGEA